MTSQACLSNKAGLIRKYFYMSWALQISSSVWNFKEINNQASDSYF